MKYLDQVVVTLLASGARTATKYVSERQVIRATRRLVRGRISRKGQNIEAVLTIGRPNYEERGFIKKCRAAKVSFPVRKILLKFPPKKR